MKIICKAQREKWGIGGLITICVQRENRMSHKNIKRGSFDCSTSKQEKNNHKMFNPHRTSSQNNTIIPSILEKAQPKG